MFQFQYSSILYVGSRVAWLYHVFHLLWFGTWRFSYLWDQISITESLISLLYVILGLDFDLSFQAMIRWFTMYFLVQLYLYTFWIYRHAFLSLSMGMPASDMSWLSDFFHWFFDRLKSGDVLSCLRKVLSMHIIYFGHHVPLLTSYIRGHLL